MFVVIHLPTIRKIPDDLWDEIKVLLLPEKSDKTIERPVIPFRKVVKLQRGKSGTKRHVLTDQKGIPLSVSFTGANTHDMKASL
jgi:hypothetical protein